VSHFGEAGQLMSGNLIIFIDSLPYYYLEETSFLRSFERKKPLTPGFGFSVNIKAELFSGLMPDEVDFFCEWGYRGGNKLGLGLLRLLSFFDLRKFMPRLDRAVHKLLLRIGMQVGNIPFAYLPFFTQGGEKSVYSPDFPHSSVFSVHKNLKMVLAEDSELGHGQRDENAYQESKKVVGNSRNVFISFVDLDYVSHEYGVGSLEYKQKVMKLDAWICNLCRDFERHHEDCNLVILSDHGMANIKRTVAINPEATVGPVSNNTYVYFLDSVILRIWLFDPSLEGRINAYLNQLGCGRILGQRERGDFGLTSSVWGDSILVLDEGYVFSPNFFGLKTPKAMHGYHPSLESQKGLLLYKGRADIDLWRIKRTIDVFGLLCNLLAD